MIDLPALPDGRRLVVYDLEVFPNAALFCAAGINAAPMAVWYRGETSSRFFKEYLRGDSVVLGGFNNHAYDDIILRAMIRGATNDELFNLSKKIIEGREGDNTVWRLQYSDTPWAYSIDVFQMLNGRGSLKEWECREGMDRVAESPVDFLSPLSPRDEGAVIQYCLNDVEATAILFAKNAHLISLRHTLSERYGLGSRVYCMTEAKLAQHTFMTLHEKRTTQPVRRVRDAARKNPDNLRREFALGAEIIFPMVKFSTPPFMKLLSFLKRSKVVAKDENGVSWAIPDAFKKPIQLGGKKYQLGVGGLHTVDEPGIFRQTDDVRIVDLDVESYYPAIIINNQLSPRHLGKGFVRDLAAIRSERLRAKHNGDKGVNEALKIVINSTFGKLNDAYSPLRSIPDALRVTINGQLMLLMLIEMLEREGAEILSANTDGVTLRWGVLECEVILPEIVKEWEHATGFKLEGVDYRTVCRRDVNSYIGLKVDGTVKYKGAFNPAPDKGKWDALVVKRAAEAYLLNDIDPLDYILQERDHRLFLYYQRVQNGGHVYLADTLVGKSARWYVSKDGRQIRRKNPKGTFVNIPNGANARLALDITGWTIDSLADLNHGHYAASAWELISSVKDSP